MTFDLKTLHLSGKDYISIDNLCSLLVEVRINLPQHRYTCDLMIEALRNGKVVQSKKTKSPSVTKKQGAK